MEELKNIEWGAQFEYNGKNYTKTALIKGTKIGCFEIAGDSPAEYFEPNTEVKLIRDILNENIHEEIKYASPKLFNPSDEDKRRIANKIAENLSDNKVVKASEKIAVQGKKRRKRGRRM